jgi:hypothetical protein
MLRSINGADIRGHEFAQATVPVRVFNRDFVSESVFPSGGGNVPAILVVGKESVEKQKEVERLKTNLGDAQTALETSRSKKRTLLSYHHRAAKCNFWVDGDGFLRRMRFDGQEGIQADGELPFIPFDTLEMFFQELSHRELAGSGQLYEFTVTIEENLPGVGQEFLAQQEAVDLERFFRIPQCLPNRLD